MKLIRLSKAKQKELDSLMDKNNEGAISSKERKDLKKLAGEVHQLTILNAKRLLSDKASQ
jgi:hypothetical protein